MSSAVNRLRMRTLPYSELVPYAVESVEECDDQLNTILRGLYVSLAARFAFSPAVTQWSAELGAWLKLKRDLPSSTRLKLTRVFYALLFASSSAAAAGRAVNIIASLWRDRLALERVTPEEAALEPEYLLNCVRKLIEMPFSAWDDLESSTVPVVLRALELLAPMISQSLRCQIWHMLLPYISLLPRGPSATLLLVLGMLPTRGKEYMATSYTLWRLGHRSSTTSAIFSLIVSGQAELVLRCSESEFGDYGALSADQCKFFYSELFKLLPVLGQTSSDQPAEKLNLRGEIGRLATGKKAQASLATFIAGPQAAKSLLLFQEFAAAATPFCHPAASDSSSAGQHVLEFMLEFGRALSFRRNTEQNGESLVPESRHLRQKDCDMYCAAALEALMFGMHSKHRSLAQLAFSGLSVWASLSPSTVLPKVLGDAYTSLQAQLHPERISASLTALSRLVPELVSSPTYKLHIPVLLELVTPFVDISDPVKAALALWFTHSVALASPLKDLSGVHGPGPAMECLPLAVQQLSEIGEWSEPEESEAKIIADSASYSYNELVPALLERCISIIENLPDSSSGNDVLLRTMSRAVASVLIGLDTELFDRLLTRILEFIVAPMSMASPDAAATIAGLFVTARPECFGAFWRVLRTQISVEIKENKAGLSKSLQIRDRALVWNVSILNMCLASSNEHLVEVADELCALTSTLHNETKGRIVYHTANSVHHAISTLLTTKPVVSTAVDDLKNLKWHRSCLKEVELAVRLYVQHTDLSLKFINEYFNGELDSDTAANQITFLRTVTAAISPLIDASGKWVPETEKLPHNTSPLRDVFDAKDLESNYKHSYGYFFDSSGGELYTKIHEYRLLVGHSLHSWFSAVAKNGGDENATKVLRELLFATKIWITDYGYEKSARAESWQRQLYQIESSIFRRPGKRKPFPNAVLARRLFLYQLQRLALRHGPRSMLLVDQQLLEDALKCSTSVYGDVRRNAEATLQSGCRVLLNARSIIFPKLLAQIKSHVMENDFKAAEAGLKLLRHQSLGSSLIKRGSDHFAALFELLSISAACQSPEVSSLALQVVLDIEAEVLQLQSWERPAGRALAGILCEVTPELEQTAREFGEFIEAKRDRRAKQLNLIVDQTQIVVEKHWRAQLVDLCALVTILPSPGVPVSDNVIAKIMKALIDQHPDISASANETFAALVSRYQMQTPTNGDFGFMLGFRDEFLRQFEVPRAELQDKLQSALYITPSHLDQQIIKPGWLAWPKTLLALDPKCPPTFSLPRKTAAKFEIDEKWLNSYLSLYCIEPKQEADHYEIDSAHCLSALVALVATNDLGLVSIERFFTKANFDERGWHKFGAEISAAVIMSGCVLSRNDFAFGCKIIFELFKRAVLQGYLGHETMAYWRAFLRRACEAVDYSIMQPWIQLLQATNLPERATRLAIRRSLETECLVYGGLAYASDEQCIALVSELQTEQIQNLVHETCRQIAVRLQLSTGLGLETGEFIALCAEQSIGATILPKQSQIDAVAAYFASNPSGKTACTLLIQLLSLPSSFLASITGPVILPFLLELSNIRDDPELVKMLSEIFPKLARLEYTSIALRNMFISLQHLLPQATWHQKMRILLFLPPLFYANRFTAKNDILSDLFTVVELLLEDSQHEVRDLAASSLCFLVRCMSPVSQSVTINRLLAVYSRTLTMRDNLNDVATRHSAVLGLGALVTAFPFAVPPPAWVPRALCTLAVQTGRDQNVVTKTVKHILSEFKKTRQDTWHLDQRVFTEEQLSALDGILWKSYFV